MNKFIVSIFIVGAFCFTAYASNEDKKRPHEFETEYDSHIQVNNLLKKYLALLNEIKENKLQLKNKNLKLMICIETKKSMPFIDNNKTRKDISDLCLNPLIRSEENLRQD